ncbi:heavy-metal-associated domain-containing protein [Kiritimatiella glycovorans]|uniref:HMA domain-containing protein n=1 Tax=Kiritimatiella glycovorans TaxID=1307763 RepID=A0A0G3EFN5_9BACT|nr:heavy metal-associated domain-containing protein [Kiritimatiella glycovorans]AKJ64217.1 hypothetical protein L21SP4_00956 [Kiritimatiella glycovorans]
MKILVFLLAAGIGLAGCVTPTGTETGATPEASLAGHQTVVVTAHGLSCPLCAHNLDGRLKKIDGVEEASVDLKTGSVTVQLAENHSVTRDDLNRAVKDAGFTPKGIRIEGAAQ